MHGVITINGERIRCKTYIIINGWSKSDRKEYVRVLHEWSNYNMTRERNDISVIWWQGFVTAGLWGKNMVFVIDVT